VIVLKGGRVNFISSNQHSLSGGSQVCGKFLVELRNSLSCIYNPDQYLGLFNSNARLLEYIGGNNRIVVGNHSSRIY